MHIKTMEKMSSGSKNVNKIYNFIICIILGTSILIKGERIAIFFSSYFYFFIYIYVVIYSIVLFFFVFFFVICNIVYIWYEWIVECCFVYFHLCFFLLEFQVTNTQKKIKQTNKNAISKHATNQLNTQKKIPKIFFLFSFSYKYLINCQNFNNVRHSKVNIG